SPHNLADISKKENGVVTNLRIVTYPNSAETWYHTKVVVQGNRIEVYINGAPILDYTDTSTSLTHGKIGLAGWTGAWGSDTVRFDNVVVTSDGGTYDIAGQVRRINSTSISGVAILASPNISATTDVSGYYTITGLITGTYTITPTKAGYIFSPPSRTVSVPPDATGQDFVGSSDKNWTVMIYLDGDNNLDPNYVSVFNQLESVANNNAANVIVAWDRLGTNNSMYYKVIYDTDLNALANYTEGVNRWTKGELNMGNPNTLSGFVQWARTSFPAQHDALFISNHGTGLNGTARDQTSGNDWITIQELGNALAAATGNGSSKLDVVFADSCLMAMMEDAYQIRNYADYYVASENLLWITNDPSSGPYDNYISLISSFTSAQDFATSLVAQYKSWLDSAWPSLPYTLSAVDLSQINSVVTAIKDLAVTLKAQMSSYGAQVAAARAETQRFDSTNNFRIEANDQYMDLFDFAMHIATHITDTMVLSQANAITTSLDGYIIAETHHSGTYRGPETNWQDVTWNLDGAHGVSIFFPPNRSSFYDVSRYDFAEGGSWPARYQGPTNQVEDGEVRWTPMLIDYFQVVQPGGPDTPNPPDLAAPSSPPLRVYLPLIVLDH
ncbi:partial Clostripain, partial [Anaerolineae bacterium]